jgi:glycosyltransferase involved in cell wall biosynthesis
VNERGGLDTAGWARNAGIPEGQYLDLGPVPNSQLPPILRDMDVGIFPNRGEGGTNLVAMECMACGMPVILSANTGHLDLIKDGNCLPLEQQTPVKRIQDQAEIMAGWGESSVAEIVEQLERVYHEREAAKEIGLRGANMLSQMTWQKTADLIKKLVLKHAQ